MSTPTYSFPYNQTLDAINLTSGTSEYTFIISACSNGLGAAEIQLTNATAPYAYSIGLPYSIDAAGASTTALTFLPGPVTPSATTPLYFLGGTAAHHLQLFSMTPTAIGSDFGASNVSASTTLGGLFQAAVASILYVPSLSTVYVAGANGNLYSYSVSWNGSTPALTYTNKNTNYSATTPGIVSMAVSSDNTTLYVTGLSHGNQLGTFMFATVAASAGSIGNGTLLANTPNSVATALSATGIYTATATGLVYHAFGSESTAGANVWTTSNQTIASLAWSANPNNAANGQYPNGALFIGTFQTATGESDTHAGSIYTYDPASGNPPMAWISNTVWGTPYSLFVDANLNLLVNSGASGLYLYGVANTEASGLPQSAELIPYNASSTAVSDLKTLETVAKLAYQAYEEYKGNPSTAAS
jgi:hypothetical protein